VKESLPHRISSFWLMIGIILLSAILAGIAAGFGDKSLFFLVLFPFGFLMIIFIPRQQKLWLLAFSIPLSLLQIPTLPTFGFSLSELLVIALAADELTRMVFRDAIFSRKSPEVKILFFSGLFAFAGLVTSLQAGNLTWWHKYCLMPLLWFLLSYKKVKNQKDVWLILISSLLTIISFVVLATWANLTGNFGNLATGTSDSLWRLGYGLLINLGPIQLKVWSTNLGSLIALGIPVCILFLMSKKSGHWWRIGIILILVLFCYALFLTAARGAAVAAVLGGFLVVFLTGRFRFPKILVIAALLFIVISLWGDTFLTLLPEKNLQRFFTLFQGVREDQNFQTRIDALLFSWQLTRQYPLGVGTSYSWNNYGIDNSIIYSYILEGTGFLGAIAFLLTVGQLIFEYGRTVLMYSIRSERDFASIGMGTLIVGLVAGVSSQSTLFEPVHSFVFWAIIAATVQGINNQV
jgi:hypothetical protein